MERREDLRVLSYIVAIAMYLLFQYPAPTLIVLGIALVLYIAIIIIRQLSPQGRNRKGKDERLAALAAAGIFLSPYTDIWKNLRLSNKNCSLYLAKDGLTIIAKELNNAAGGYRTFRITKYKKHAAQEVWNMFCINFDYFTNYDGLVEFSKIFGVEIREKYVEPQSQNAVASIPQKSSPKRAANKNREKVDINNASEIEITALPGISIVLSKRIIKKREEIRGFKSVDDFFLFIKVKPHMQKQLRDLVCVNKMKGSLSLERFKERNIDL